MDVRSPEYIRRSIGRCPTTPEQCSRSTCDRLQFELNGHFAEHGHHGTLPSFGSRKSWHWYYSGDRHTFNSSAVSLLRILDRGHMYYAIVKRIALHNFLRVNRKDYAAILKSCSPDIHHRFGGHHALGGERHDREALARWFDRLWAGWHLRCNSQFTMYG